MNKVDPVPTSGTNQNYRGWQSDVIVDLIKQYGFEYITLNPGASFRGLHDSLINYGGNQPPMLLCQHEKIAVQIAHGYAKASGRPMAVILHNLVGLLHAPMGIYYAYIDRVPIFIMGATGPMDEGKRRPHIDWTHTALVQGEAVRNFVKWDYQPTSIDGVPESFARAYSAMTTAPEGPIYMCYDAALQEAPLDKEVPLPPVGAVATPTPMVPDRGALEAIADKLLKADTPLLLTEFVGRRKGGFENLVQLAETVGAGVWDINNALSFPNRHPLSVSLDKGFLKNVDLVVGLDVKDWEKPTHELNSTMRTLDPLVKPDADWVEVGYGEIGISKWSMDYGRMQPCSVRALGDAALALPDLTRLCQTRIDGDTTLKKRVADRAAAVGKRHDETWAKWQEEARKDWDAAPMTVPRLALEVWDVDQGRRLGPRREHPQELGAAAVGLRQAVPPSRPGPRHRHADRHLARRGPRPQGQRAPRRRHPARRRPHVRRGRAVEGGQARDPDPDRHVQQPRLLQRLGAPDPHGAPARHRRGQGAYRHGPLRPGAGLRRPRALHGHVGRGPDRQPEDVRAALLRAPSRR